MMNVDLNYKRPITDVIIDMTSWATGEVNNEQYPYTVLFKDDDGKRHEFSSKRIKSDGMVNLLNEMENNYNATPLDTTRVSILCPRELLYNTSSVYGGHTKCTVEDLRQKGIDVLDFDIKDDATLQSRLESVLDEVTHRACKQYYCDPKFRKPSSFPHSIYHHIRVDNEHAKRVEMEPDADKGPVFVYA